MLLGRNRIIAELERGAIVCEPAPKKIEATHIDVHLANERYWVSNPETIVNGMRLTNLKVINIATDDPRDVYHMMVIQPDMCVQIPPYSIVLCATHERIGTTVPNIIPLLETRSTVARWGLQVHLSAGWGDPGYRDRWTLEIANHHNCWMKIPVLSRIGSVAFFEVDGNDELYPAEGRYQHATFDVSALLPRIGNV